MTGTADKKLVPWRIEKVPPDEDNSRLDRFLRRLVPGLAQGSIEKMLRNGLIRLDGAKARANSRISVGQSVRLPPDLRPAPVTSIQGTLISGKSDLSAPKIIADADLRRKFDDMVLAEGRGWIAINKPSRNRRIECGKFLAKGGPANILIKGGYGVMDFNWHIRNRGNSVHRRV